MNVVVDELFDILSRRVVGVWGFRSAHGCCGIHIAIPHHIMYNGVHVLGSMKNMVLNARWAQEKNY
jgi:hypothetical protein